MVVRHEVWAVAFLALTVWTFVPDRAKRAVGWGLLGLMAVVAALCVAIMVVASVAVLFGVEIR